MLLAKTLTLIFEKPEFKGLPGEIKQLVSGIVSQVTDGTVTIKSGDTYPINVRSTKAANALKVIRDTEAFEVLDTETKDNVKSFISMLENGKMSLVGSADMSAPEALFDEDVAEKLTKDGKIAYGLALDAGLSHGRFLDALGMDDKTKTRTETRERYQGVVEELERHGTLSQKRGRLYFEKNSGTDAEETEEDFPE
jgi:hypothetical protein